MKMKIFKNQRIIKYAVLILLSFVFSSYIEAKVYGAKSDKKFYDLLMKRSLGVAMFYKEDKELKKDKEYGVKIKQLENMFSIIGRQGYYQEGGVQFIKANTVYDTIDELAQSFSIKELPALLLFKNGVALKDAQGNYIVLTGWVNYEQVENFIRSNLKDDIEQNVKRRAEELRRQREIERLYRPYPYFYWGWGDSYYPYWRPGWGWYGGWGCRYRRCW
jgi:hypothetical protein